MLISQSIFKNFLRAFIRSGLLLTLGSSCAYALVLTPGNYSRQTFAITSGNSYEISYNQSNCSINDGINTCCTLFLNHGDNAPLTNSHHFAIASTRATASMLIDTDRDENISIAIYASHPTRNCTFDAPVIKATAITTSTLASGTGLSQLSTAINNIGSSRIDVGDNLYYLRDVSRRLDFKNEAGGNNGLMSSIAAITTQRITGFDPVSDALFYDYSPAADNKWQAGFGPSDEADAQVNTIKTYDYWVHTLFLNSYDGQGSSMEAFVNLAYPLKDANFCGSTVPAGSLFNAFSIGSSIYFSKAKFTDFSGEYHDKSLSAALDVTAHEWAHSLTDSTANLNYERESGALNEAFSDWMGIAVERANGINNWTIGEDIEAFRDLSNPGRFGDPDTYQGENWIDTSTSGCPTPDVCENDYCGVHGNSGVANKMFYLLVEGGSFNGVSVTGIGIDRAMQIATDAMRYEWTSNETFLSARAGMEAAAAQYSAANATQVANAWRAVGVKTTQEIADETASAAPFGGGGGGGCSLNTNHSSFDPTLYLLLLLSLLYLAFNKRLRKANPPL